MTKRFSLVLSPKTKSSGHRFSRMMAAVLALILGLSLMACSNPSTTAPSSSEADTTDTSAQVSDTETEAVSDTDSDTTVDTEAVSDTETEAETDPVFPDYEVKTMYFLGDSITYGSGLKNAKQRFSSVLAERFGATEKNYGNPGSLVAQAGNNADNNYALVNQIHRLDAADVAIFFGGTNDYFWSTKPITGGEDKSYFEYAMKTVCQHILDTREGKITIFVTPYPHNGTGNYEGGSEWNASSTHDTSDKNYFGLTLEDYVDTIVKVCKEYGIPCLNLHEDFGFNWEQHTIDGCHPNEEGHRLIADAIEAKLNAMLGKS